ncbi:MAG: BrnT family toxin [Devosia sp.]
MDPYEWDETKYATNLEKHGIAFELIHQFDWSTAAFRLDERQDYGEVRRLAFGRIGHQGYAVVYVIRGDKVRLISLRNARDKELKRYGL